MKNLKNFTEMTPAEKYNYFINEIDNDSHIDKMPTEKEVIDAREKDAKLPKKDFSFFFNAK